MSNVNLNPQQREAILDWMRAQSDPFTYRDVELYFNVHYLTAYKWVNTLKTEGFVARYPFRRGRADQFVVNAEAMSPSTPGVHSEAALRALRVARGNDQLSVAQWATANVEHASIAAIARAMLYLYARSYYFGAPEHEHLRGPIPVVEVRSFIAEQLAQVKRDVAVIEQLLSFKQPWGEDDALAQRFGEFPPGTTMTQVLEMAHFYTRVIMKVGVEPQIETLPAEAPTTVAPRTVGEALAQSATSTPPPSSPPPSPPPAGAERPIDKPMTLGEQMAQREQ